MLTYMGLDPLAEFIFEEVAKPLSAVLYKGLVGQLDSFHGYTVGYGPVERANANITRKALIPHVDDSEVTFNCCLSGDFEGGGLFFHGLRTGETQDPQKLPTPSEYCYRHKLGRAILHLGQHFHEVAEVSAGQRHVLIIWMRGMKTYRANRCPCCLKHRREECVCAPAWN